MKTLFVKLTAISAGTVVALGLLVIGLYWTSTRPKKWDSSAITAKLMTYQIFQNKDNAEEPHYYTNLYFDVTNNTGTDYTLPAEAWSKHMLELQSGSLLGSSGWEISLSQGTMPYKVPEGFFDPKPILIPARSTVRLTFVNDSAYTNEHVRGKTKQQIAEESFGKVDQLVLLDEQVRYRINFPVNGFWNKPESQ